MMVYVFNKVFRVQELSIGREVVIYFMMALGAFILLIFQIDKLPIVQCLVMTIALMFLVRIRNLIEKRRKKVTNVQR